MTTIKETDMTIEGTSIPDNEVIDLTIEGPDLSTGRVSLHISESDSSVLF